MDYEFQIMTQQQAENIASNWHYDGMYSFYNADADEEDLAELMSPQKRGDKYIVGKKGNEVVGYFSFETKDDSVVIGLGMNLNSLA
ncbi:ribosomal-protein-alanine acetyltransferase [Geomicrobium sp. JCM 19037]|nr:ribosomal-protein-alanine acetyltransferase [Geomicrobium sp. JCM 19037]